MHLVLRLNRDGDLEGFTAVSNGSQVVFATVEARKQMLENATEVGYVCKACGVIALPAELDATQYCQDGVGCTLDVDRQTLRAHPNAAMAIIHDIVQTLWDVFVKKTVRNQEAKLDQPPEVGNGREEL